MNASQSSSEVAVDPADPSKLAAVWVDYDPTLYADTDDTIETVLEGAYSVDGGQIWLPLFGEPGNGFGIPADPELLNPTTSGPTLPYVNVSNPSLGFDNTGNFYILSEYNSGSSGALALQKYSFTGSTPSVVNFTKNEQTPDPYGSFGGFFGSSTDLKVIYQWDNTSSDDQALDPTMTVDDNVASLPAGVTSQLDPYSGNIYISWATIDVNTAIPILDFNPNRVDLVVSSDGGNNFSPMTVTNINAAAPEDTNGPTTQRDSGPAVTVSQGRLPTESGVGGDPGIPGGEVAVTWDNFGQDQIMANTVNPGQDYSFGQQLGESTGIIPEGTADTTTFKIPVAITNTVGLTTLDVTVNIVDSSDADLGLTLIAPNGDTFILVLNQVPTVGGTANTGIGISGANMGVVTYTTNNIATYAMGTTFDDSAVRDIFDPTRTGTNGNTAPYIGDFRPENNESLDEFLTQELQTSTGINGTWILKTNDTNTPPTTPPTTPNYLINWSLSFGRGLAADPNDVVVPTAVSGIYVAKPITGNVTEANAVTGELGGVPSSPIDIGPGLVMAQDNTLGNYSPYEGRIYAAFVGYVNVKTDGFQNPASNTDIFLTYSNDDGRTWSTPIEVNDDSADADGSSGANDTNPEDQVSGNSQYQPEIAVDQTTGTVVLSWRDARNDPANTLVATYIATSIDGGNTFSPEVYANPSSKAIDAITGATDVLGPEGDNATTTDNAVNAPYGFGTSMGLAVFGGQVYPMWAGNFDEATLNSAGVAVGDALSIYYQPMVIAAGPRIVGSSMGPIPLSTGGLDSYQQAEQGSLSFTVTFDRPINPPGTSASFTTADVQVFFEGTTYGDALVPLDILTVTPVASSGVGPGNKFGYTEFTVTFNPLPPGATASTYNYTCTYSYIITPDDENGNAIEEPIPSYGNGENPQAAISVVSADVPLPIPSKGTGGTNTTDDITTSTLALTRYNNQVITGVTLNLTLANQPLIAGSVLNDSALVITLTAPDGQNVTINLPPGTRGPYNLTNYAINGLDTSRVDGTYTLTIDDPISNNSGVLTAWSLVINSYLPTYVLRSGDAMDQNADGTSDQNPLNTTMYPDGFTGTTPGDVYAVPTPDPTAAITFTTAQSILTPPFNQNTLPLIVSGPQILTTTAVSTSGQDVSNPYGTEDSLVNSMTSQFDVTFDRPMQTSSFTGSGANDQVLSIMGPSGSILGPQTFGSTSVDQSIPAATSSSVGTLDSTLTINSNNTLNIADLTVELNIASASDSGLTAVLVAPNGDKITLFSGVGGSSGQNFVNTVFDDSALNSISTGTAPFTGTFKPEDNLSAYTLTSLQGLIADGLWQLKVTNTSTGAPATLDSWSLNITPQVKVVPVSPSTVTVNGVQETVATTFAIDFPQQELSGTYTIQLGPAIKDEFGDEMDVNQDAGLAALRDQDQNGPTSTVKYSAVGLPSPIVASGSVSSSIVVPDSFTIQGDTTSSGISGLQVQLNATFPTDATLTATLTHYDSAGDEVGQMILFSGVGTGTHTANFDNTVFDDNAATPIEEGSAPFFATFNPQESLATAFAGMNAKGIWTLTITNSATGVTGTINSWSLSFQKLLPTSGLGQPGSDDASLGFSLFTLGQTDALSSEQWTSVGAASGSYVTGQVNAIGVDPSDPSGNTVYVGGAEGGIWKTTDFLTTSPNGPTWIPLTNFGPNAAINISSITIFPRNDNPNQSIIIAATGAATGGEHASDAPGVGFLISDDGGATWNLYDSSTNVDANGNLLPIDSSARNREFVGTTAYQVTVDPQAAPGGGVIIYAALSGTNGGIWRSENTGQTWTQVLAGNATAVVLDQDSGIVLDPTTGAITRGNLQIVYAGIEGVGVEMSTNQGQSWSLMTGTIGNPQIVDTYTGKNVNPATSPNPNGAEGRIVLAVPAATGNTAFDLTYAGFLYAAVATSSGGFDGLFLTKDFGQTWTSISIPTYAPLTNGGIYNQAVPTQLGDVNTPNTPGSGTPNYAITDDTQGNLDLALTVDPTNPNISYLGGFGGDGYNSDTGLIRINATNLWDSHSLVSPINQTPGKTTLDLATNGPTTYDSIQVLPEADVDDYLASFENFIRNPDTPFLSDSTLLVYDYASFVNNGAGVTWTPFDVPVTGEFNAPGEFTGTLTIGSAVVTGIGSTTGLAPDDLVTGIGIPANTYIVSVNSATSVTLSADATVNGVEGLNNEISGNAYQIAVSEVDPTTGLPRLIFGNNDGIYSVLDNNGTFEATIGTSNATPTVNRNGNLDLAQFYYGAAEPSNAAAQAADALFIAGAQNTGGQYSNPNELTDGNLQWGALQEGGTFYIASGTAVDQQGNGTLYQYWSPGQGGADTSFVMVNGIGRTFGLLQASGGLPTPDPQWPLTSWANIVVDPVNGQDLLISSSTGNIFDTTNEGLTWFDIGTPATFGSPANTSYALAYGAPDPSAPEGVGNLGNFVYVGTATGSVYVTQNAGGSWSNISLGLDGSSVNEIVTDPARGSHDAYAVTDNGVYYLANSILLAQNPTDTADEWVNITGNLKSLAYSIFGASYNPTTGPAVYDPVTLFNSIAANWNYAIPNNPANLSLGYHPVLYVAGNSGVYMSTNNGTSWTLYPDSTFGAVVEGGNLPEVDVTDLSLSQGNIAVATGMPDLAGPYNPEDPNATADPDLLMASTYGEGAFAINLAPMLFPATVAVDPADGSTVDGTTTVTTATPTIDGESEISGFGSATWVSIVDETPGDSTFGQIIGGFNPALVTGSTTSITANASNSTDSFGNFAIPINSGVFTSVGVKTIEIYTTDDAGSVSNKVTLTFTVQVSGLTPPSAPVTPTLQLITSTPGYTNNPTPELTGVTSANATVELYQVVSGLDVAFSPALITTADANGNFTFTFPDMTGGNNGTFGPYTVVAQASNNVGSSGYSTPTTFTILIGTPAAPSNFALATSSDTGIVGDDITSDRTPDFTGTTEAGATVELFEVGSSTVYNTTTANAQGVFNIQLPFSLTDGTISLYVEATDPAGNLSAASNTLTVTIVSVAADYNGDSYSDAALYSRTTVSFTGTLTSGSPLVSGLSSLTGLVSGVAVTGTGVPSGTTIAAVNTASLTGALVTGSALVTGISSTTGLFAGENISGTGIPAGTKIKAVSSSSSITLSANATASSSQSSLTLTTVTLSANATVSGVQSLTADPGVWLIESTSVGPANPAAFWVASGTAFGPSNVTPFQGDFDGDGLTDLAYYQSSTATWYMYDSKSGSMASFALGTPNVSVPVVGYFSAKGGPEEAAVFTIVNGQGVWSIAGGSTVTFGQAGDIPVPGDYTGIGYDELAVYRPSTGQFLVLVPGAGGTTTTETLSIPGIGVGTPDLSSLVPVPDAYNNKYYYEHGEAERIQAAVFDPNTGVYTILGPAGVYTISSGFQKGDIPAPADYVGEGFDQEAVFRPSTGQFILAGGTVIATFGNASADIPLTAPLSYRTPSDPPADPPAGGTGGSTGTGVTTGTSTGTGTTTTGTGTTTTGTGGTTGTGSGTSSTGQGTSTTTTTSTSSTSSTPPVTVPGTSSHKKKVSKAKKVVHPKKVVHAKPKKVEHSATKPKVHVVKHSDMTVVNVSTSHTALAKKPKHVVDLALESVHVNLRRSSGKKA